MISTHLLFYLLCTQLLPFTAYALPAGNGIFSQLSSINQTFHEIVDQVSGGANPLSAPTPPQCSTTLEWNVPQFISKDCETALDWMAFEELSEGKDLVRFEFINSRAKPKYKLKQQLTPRKYTFGTCTIAIIMTGVFAPGELPGDHGQLERFETDVSTWRKVYEGAKTVLRNCVRRDLKAGWVSVGSRQSIGIFFWATGSFEDVLHGHHFNQQSIAVT